MVGCNHCLPLSRPSDSRFHHQQNALAQCLLGQHRTHSPMLDPRHRFHGRNHLNRRLPVEQQIPPKSRLMRLIVVEQWKSRHNRQTFWPAVARPVVAISKLPVLLCTIYYFLNFAWIIGVNATISIWLTTIYKFTPYNLGRCSILSDPLVR